MIIEIATITIAVIALFLSMYAIVRDRTEKRLDNLQACRDRIFRCFDDNDDLTVDEMVEYFEENKESSDAQKHQAKSQRITRQVDREIEYSCFLVIKKQIDFNLFTDLFIKWFAFRYKDWESRRPEKRKNYPMTWALIQKCVQKGKIPLNKQKNI